MIKHVRYSKTQLPVYQLSIHNWYYEFIHINPESSVQIEPIL